MRFSTILVLGACQAGAALAQMGQTPQTPQTPQQAYQGGQGPQVPGPPGRPGPAPTMGPPMPPGQFAGHNGTLTPGQTITRNVARTRVGIVTACPPEVTHCPLGSRTTAYFTETTAVCPIPAYNDRRIVCYGNYCAPQYHCPSCERYRVVCRGNVCQLELATTPEYHRLVVCNGGRCQYQQCQGAECNRKINCNNGQCAYEACSGNSYQRNLVCRGDRCRFQQCNGGQCYQKLVCQGKQCTPQPGCGGAGATCPIPPPFGTPIKPVGGPNVAANRVALNAKCPGGNVEPNGAGSHGAVPNAGACPGGKFGPKCACLGASGSVPSGNGANCPGGQADRNGVCPGDQPGSGELVQVAGSTKTTAFYNLIGAAAGLVLML